MRVPFATYRLQFNRNFRYKDAQAIVPYLHRLGISHIYASPTFQARTGSEHGYDVADPTRINAEVGTQPEFNSLIRQLHKHGMDLLLDIVPNHMAASVENPWWNDVLENGQNSRYAHFFDIDWDAGIEVPALSGAAISEPVRANARRMTPAALKKSIEPTRKGRVLLPVLGDSYGSVLKSGELMVRVDDQGFYVDYHALRIPLAPESYVDIFRVALSEMNHHQPSARSNVLRRKLQALIRNFKKLDAHGNRTSPTASQFAPSTRSTAHSAWSQQTTRLKRDLLSLRKSSGEFGILLAQALQQFAASEENPLATQRLDDLLSKQSYRLAFWRAAQEEINYRRFFDIGDLICLRVELPDVFRARHAFIAQLIRQGAIGALRVDHIDGLRDPLEYLERARTELRPTAVKARGPRPAGAAVPEAGLNAVYTVVEKVICGKETLPRDWPVEGTSGYDFLNAANFLFASPEGYRQLEKFHSRITGDQPSFEAAWQTRKLMVMDLLFRSETRALTRRLVRLAAIDRQARDLSRSDLRHGLNDITAALPVYRTYIRDHTIPASDRQILLATLDLAAQGRGSLRNPRLKSFYERLFKAELDAEPKVWRSEWLEFMLRWQVFTGPVMAKGFEDTAFYTYVPLISLNDVGGNPGRGSELFGAAPFHDFIRARMNHWPHSLNATSTHDTKRSEDVRARINVLSELAPDWSAATTRWREWNRKYVFSDRGDDNDGSNGNHASHKADASKDEKSYTQQDPTRALKRTPEAGLHQRPLRPTPSPREESLIYQSFIGAWPFRPRALENLAERMRNFVVKAAREAKDCSSWLDPNQRHEEQLQQFISRILDRRTNQRFIANFEKFHARLAIPGAINSLSQLLLKITAPGVPDFYQGNELWDFSLTDPDNRRPVDFRKRTQLLRQLHPALRGNRARLCAQLISHWKDSRIKLFLTTVALQFRRKYSDLFAHGAYVPLYPTGPAASNLLAFLRIHQRQHILIAVPRLIQNQVNSRNVALNAGTWKGTHLTLAPNSPTHWRDIFSGQYVALEKAAAVTASSLAPVELFRHLPFAMLFAEPERRQRV